MHKRIFSTGGAGFIGSALGEELPRHNHTSDIACACHLGPGTEGAVDRVSDSGSARQHPTLRAAAGPAFARGKPRVGPEITERHRAGDVRHCFSNISLARRALGLRPPIEFADGQRDHTGWLEGRIAVGGMDGDGPELAAGGLPV